MKTKLAISAILAAVFLVVGPFSAAGTTSAKIDKLLVFEQGNLLYIYPEGGVVNPPACHGSNGDYYS